jgi:hypothetical protein
MSQILKQSWERSMATVSTVPFSFQRIHFALRVKFWVDFMIIFYSTLVCSTDGCQLIFSTETRVPASN